MRTRIWIDESRDLTPSMYHWLASHLRFREIEQNALDALDDALGFARWQIEVATNLHARIPLAERGR